MSFTFERAILAELPYQTGKGGHIRHSGPIIYFWSALITAAAIILRLALIPLTGSAVPFITCVVAALGITWFSGFWPAAFSTLISATAGAYYILRSTPQLEHTERPAIAGFVLVCLAICWLVDFQRKTLARANAAELAQRAARDELASSNAELLRANQDLEAFAYSVSHDLQEPIRTISIYAQLLQQKLTGLSGEDRQSMNEIVRGARQMTALIRDILTYTRSARQEDHGPAWSDSVAVAGSVVETLRPMIAETGARVVVNGLPPAAIHPARMTQVFQNLVANAIKYRGEAAPHVHISGEVQDGMCIFSVSDNGVGIEPQYAEQVFELFKRLHPQHVVPGSGVGLAICRRVLEQYGGRIWLERSAAGEGSVFRFSVPTPK